LLVRYWLPPEAADSLVPFPAQRKQNEQLDRLNGGMDELNVKITKTNKRVKKHLKGR
jgi:hypothetical protein